MIKPVRNRVLVKPSEVEKQTSGGLYIPDNAKDKPMKGEVLEVGSGHLTPDGTIVALELQVGQTVLFNKGAGVKVDVDNENYLILEESQILAILY